MKAPTITVGAGTFNQRSVTMVLRWLVVHQDGRPFYARQGRYSWPTEAEALAVAQAFIDNPSNDPKWVKGLTAAPWWCWPWHFDPYEPAPKPQTP